MPKTKKEKEKIIDDLEEKLKRAKTITFVNYQGLEAKKLSDLRKRLTDQKIDFQIIKNNLFKISIKKTKLKEIDFSFLLKGPLACAFSYQDEVLANKILFDFSKKNENLKILNCILDNQILDQEKTLELAKLLSKEELLGKLIAVLQNPLINLTAVLQENFKRLLNIFSSVKNSKHSKVKMQKSKINKFVFLRKIE